jgi:hypothetical protein
MFGNVSCDNNYKLKLTNFSHNHRQIDKYLTVNTVANTIRRLKQTATGADLIPSWFIKDNTFIIAPILTKIYNLAIHQETYPTAWKIAQIKPIPKERVLSSIDQLRPIAVTSILSRLFERILVCNYIATNIPLEVLNNQFAFRATGSTTAALIAINHSIATTLEENQYARAVLFDFSKAFDGVDHDVLFNKLSRIPLPTKIFRLIISFLSDRKQYTLINGNQSLPAPINMGIIQGSVLGPTLFTILVNDIRPLNKINHLIKYADDLTLIYSPKSPISIEDKVNNIINWSLTNKLAINYKKIKKLYLQDLDSLK